MAARRAASTSQGLETSAQALFTITIWHLRVFLGFLFSKPNFLL